VQAHVDDAVALGAQVLVGGTSIPGTSFFHPTVLCDVPTSARINSEETFGPLAALIKFETEEEVIKLANSTDVGLAGYFFSRDIGRVWRVAEKLEVGSEFSAFIFAFFVCLWCGSGCMQYWSDQPGGYSVRRS
jgi:succinate-semialdehyde dehydrogenase/glutarate-semialdehyde dehydrogenase